MVSSNLPMAARERTCTFCIAPRTRWIELRLLPAVRPETLSPDDLSNLTLKLFPWLVGHIPPSLLRHRAGLIPADFRLCDQTNVWSFALWLA